MVGTQKTILELNNSSLTVRNSVFPTIDNSETIHGTGMPADGHVIIENNVFGKDHRLQRCHRFHGWKTPRPDHPGIEQTHSWAAETTGSIWTEPTPVEGNTFQAFHRTIPATAAPTQLPLTSRRRLSWFEMCFGTMTMPCC